VSTEHIPSRPHVQGSTRPLPLRPSAQELTDGAGLLVLRCLWDELDLGRWIEAHTAEVGSWFSSSLMVEVWTALLWYGGDWMDDLELMARRRVRRLFGWERVPDPTTFGRWVRRAGAPLLPVLDQLIRRLVRIRWTWTGVPQTVTLVLDSTVAVRYCHKQAGAEVGTIRRSRAGRATIRCWPSSREGIFPKAKRIWTNSGRLWGDRLLSLEGRRLADLEAEGGLEITTTEITGELGQLSVGQTAVDDLDGNRLLWALGGLAYQLLHTLRSQLPGPWRVAQPKRLRTWLFRLAGRFTTSGDSWRLDVPPEMLGSGLRSRTIGVIGGPPLR